MSCRSADDLIKTHVLLLTKVFSTKNEPWSSFELIWRVFISGDQCIFTRISAFVPWIEKNSQSEFVSSFSTFPWKIVVICITVIVFIVFVIQLFKYLLHKKRRRRQESSTETGAATVTETVRENPLPIVLNIRNHNNNRPVSYLRPINSRFSSAYPSPLHSVQPTLIPPPPSYEELFPSKSENTTPSHDPNPE